MMWPPSSIVGTTPLGFIFRYQGWSFLPNAPPTSSRSYFTPHSSAHHSTFITLIELARPQIFIALCSKKNRHPERSRRAFFVFNEKRSLHSAWLKRGYDPRESG